GSRTTGHGKSRSPQGDQHFKFQAAMKFLLTVFVCGVCVYAQNQVVSPPTNTRDLPANSVRDNPNGCFAVTQNKTYEVGQSWSLTPFCGRSTCGRGNQGLVERVQDCGNRPKKTPGCEYINEADLQKDFPECCPKFECLPGAKLQYPSDQELREAFEAAQRQAAQGGQRPPPGGK
ncbi:hypothetical protein SK128_014355, partial [Halocaridina rubra]